ncbi:uncharacterized protein MYCFIDRAFT_175025 [Pseudocercospora fijiensis CIRAD86]|uniref:Uncharacterized protein n=1 Tax=Pseudocercospora fijiensis (strain CIRAD86) TaxID=383855 RepID=M2Z187_PSEFD|nr:uncharacterized protein MYCFIDRAFT_175025 [Pseudocercospora fijiensis CIRAD86]EME83600.1 hypothetical protein MYCFIDRAFT_175025 [Pseudocercospora fijiensis CIRAD86]
MELQTLMLAGMNNQVVMGGYHKRWCGQCGILRDVTMSCLLPDNILQGTIQRMVAGSRINAIRAATGSSVRDCIVHVLVDKPVMFGLISCHSWRPVQDESHFHNLVSVCQYDVVRRTAAAKLHVWSLIQPFSHVPSVALNYGIPESLSEKPESVAVATVQSSEPMSSSISCEDSSYLCEKRQQLWSY